MGALLVGMMCWSHESTETSPAWMREAGFEIEWERFVREGDGGHALVLAQT
jgi:hypothetical protein